MKIRRIPPARVLCAQGRRLCFCQASACSGLGAGMLAAAGLQVLAGSLSAREVLLTENFTTPPVSPWRWIRPEESAWKATPKGLEVKILAGNLWGPANDAKNLLARPAPEPGPRGVEVAVTVSHRPVSQYEQMDLTWYYDDSHMVKIGLERVDGKVCIVMGREEKDQTRTVSLNPLPEGTETVTLRLTVRDREITGHWQRAGNSAWESAGATTLPVPAASGKSAASPPAAHICLQTYQGSVDNPLTGLFGPLTVVRL